MQACRVDDTASQAFRGFRLDWRAKAAAFRLLTALPGTDHLYYLAQRHVTRTLPRDLAEYGHWQFEHARTFQRHAGVDITRARLFEFGAGWDLHSSFVQWCYGVNHQVVVDISRLARIELINLVIDHLRHSPPPGSTRVPEIALTDPLEESLQRLYGIRYVAPGDARKTGLESGSVDLICTTSVLEHVPAGVIAEIMRECNRLCHAGSVMSHVIDYTDHYAHSDGSINIYNFMRFSETEWARYNPPIHYQNRLRHFEYGRMFEAAGFVAVAETSLQRDDASSLLSGVPLAAPFRTLSEEQLLPATGHWVLRRR